MLTVRSPSRVTLPEYTSAKLFESVGKQTPTFLRFSTVGGERGSADTERDPRGFALKFYTKKATGTSLVTTQLVFFIRDPLKFPDFIHTQKRLPQSNLKSARIFMGLRSHSPEALHQVTILFSDRGIPDGYRHMHGFGSHTYSLIARQRRASLGEVAPQDPARNQEPGAGRGRTPGRYGSGLRTTRLVRAIERGDFRNGAYAFRS